MAVTCLLSGCTTTGIYSVQYHETPLSAGGISAAGLPPETEYLGPSPADSMPCDSSSDDKVSFGEAVAALCGPPELFHEELLHGDPGAIVAPTPKYHPLPTRPVFAPSYYPPPNGLPIEGMAPQPPPAEEQLTQGGSHWRGPSKRFAAVHGRPPSQPRVARNPLNNLSFPELDPWHVPPQKINPGGSQPLRAEPVLR